LAVGLGAACGLAALVLAAPAGAQTTGTTAPTTTTTVAPSAGAGNVTTQTVCVANSAASWIAAFTTASSPTFGCSDGAGNQVIDVTASFTLTGQGSYTGTQPIIINGNGNSLNAAGGRAFTTTTAGTTTVNNLVVTGGNDGGGRGGAIRTSGPLVVSGSTFTGNTATNGRGALDVEGGNVTVTNSTFSSNTASGDTGGALRVHGSATAVTSITGSTFSGNSDTGNVGGAIYSDGIVSLLNSTLTGNSVTDGNSGAAVSAEQITVAYSDVIDNTAPTASNGQLYLHRASPRAAGVIKLFGSVIGTFPSGTADCSFAVAPDATSMTFGYNYLSDTTCLPGPSPAPVPAATDVVTTAAPLLGALANNGGPTPTLLPGAGSPLIDKIVASACQTPPLATGVTTDQRGLPRPDTLSPNCDVGAVEVQPPTTAPTLTAAFTG